MNKPHALAQQSTAIPAAGDAELRFRITDYSYALISETGAVTYVRAWRSDAQSRPLTLARARNDAVPAQAASELENELALSACLDDTWAIKSTGSVLGAGSMVLLYDDADILALDKLAPHAVTIACFFKLAPQLAQVVACLHGEGLIHRNISPSCFFVGIDHTANREPDYRVRIGGFGLAVATPESGRQGNITALLRGNFPYMSPEHSGRTRSPVDARSDLYSLGVIFYRLLTGHLPFGVTGVANDAAEWMHFHIASEPVAPHLLNTMVPERVSDLVMRLLKKNPEHRHQNAAQLLADLDQCRTAVQPHADTADLANDPTSPALPTLPAQLPRGMQSHRMHQAMRHYHAGDYALAAACMAVGEEENDDDDDYNDNDSDTFPALQEYAFFNALILAACEVPADQQAPRLRELKQRCKDGGGPGVAGTPASSIQTAILLGEIARLDSDALAALRHYEQAVNHAEKTQRWHYAAIAHELAARVSRDQGLSTSLAAHFTCAQSAFTKWGAPELATQLARRYPEVVAMPILQHPAPLSETASIRDLESVMRAARALSEEIRLDELIQTIMSVTLEHVGAERGLLIRLDEQIPYIDACARTTTSGITVDLLHLPASDNDLPMAMLRQAISSGRQSHEGSESRSGKQGGLPHAARFTALCVPMLKQGRVVGALYLENRVLPDAFTMEHTQILQLLAAQAAISLETARLYAALLSENTQRTVAEKALRASQSSLVLGEQFNHIGSMRYVLEEGLMFCSAELCRIYELEAGKDFVTYEEFSALLHPDDRKTVLDTVEAAVAVGGTIRVEHRICRKSGEIRYISGIGKPFYVDGKFSEYVGTATDITNRRRAEDALRVAQADLERVSRATTVGQLTSSIAHEINQPLMSIVSNAGASLRWLDRDPMQLEHARAGLRDIVTEGQRAGDMIQSLQRLTRNTEPVFERVNLNAAIRHILAISRSEIERRAVSLSLSLTQENWYVMGDFVQIQQVLLNLVINAIEAMAEIGTRPRMLSITSRSIDDQRIVVVIEDTGEGIAPDALSRIFDAFYSTKKNGMGMGLAICRSIVENHRGRLHVAARPAYGSSFSFELPLAPALQ